MTSTSLDQSTLPTPNRLYWLIVIAFGILPNIPLLLMAVAVAFMAFNSSALYAASSHPAEFLLVALMLAGAPVGNLLVFTSSRFRNKIWLYWAVVAANIGLVLFSFYGWKKSFETSSAFAPPVEALLGVIGVTSLGTLAWIHLSLYSRWMFSLRQLLTLTAGISIFLAVAVWIVRPDQSGRYVAQAPMAKHFQSLGGGVLWDNWEIVAIQAKACPVKDQDLKGVSELSQLKSLTLDDTKVTDAGMESLQSLDTLEHLYLDNTAISDAGLDKIANLTKLQNLWLHNTAVTDNGLHSLSRMENLGYLDLGGTNVTDKGLEHLRHLRRLYYLHLPGTRVTKSGIDRLHDALPYCRIYGTPGGVDYSVGP